MTPFEIAAYGFWAALGVGLGFFTFLVLLVLFLTLLGFILR